LTHFIVEFPLKTEKFQEDILNKRFEIGRKMYNSLANETYKAYKEMIRTKEYREAVEKKDFKIIKSLIKSYGFSEYNFHSRVKKYQHTFKKNIDSQAAQKIGTRLWKAYEKLFYGNGKKIHYKKFGEFNSFEGKSNETGIRFMNNHLAWNKLKIPVIIEHNNSYEIECFLNKISFSKIVRKYVRNQYKFYIQIVFSGLPPKKRCKETGYFKRELGSGDVGLDIGTQTLAISSKTDVKMLVLADKVQVIENEKRRILRKMDRSRRSMNPKKYNENGTFKKGRLLWIYSKKYIKLRFKLKELYRKQADMRKYQHECLANDIISLGDKFYVEKMSFSGLQKRAKTTEENKNKRKKRFGKSIANRAPAMFLEILNRKLSYFDKEVTKINTIKARASQFNHIDKTYKKKKLSQRWNNLNGFKVQRDLYSSFLIMNINEDLESFNETKNNNTFEKFIEMHNLEVKRLLGQKNLSSIAI
jgi:hypothetical protein